MSITEFLFDIFVRIENPVFLSNLIIYAMLLLSLIGLFIRNFREIIPNFLMTLGILGTLVGIGVSLAHLDVNNIENSIPSLLEGFKAAFLTGIVGIFLAFFIKNIILPILKIINKKSQQRQG